MSHVVRGLRPRYVGISRRFSTSMIKYKELPRPSQQYMSDMGEQPTPLTENDIAAKEVADIELPQATIDEKAEIKKAMKWRSLRMTFWQLFLVTLLGSSTLNIMRERNLKEELDDNFDKKFSVIKKLTKDAENGKITVEEARESLKSWNERFVDVFELKPIELKGVEGIDKKQLELAYKKVKGIDIGEDSVAHKTNEKLDKFL
ncbi:hypothetical protein C6P40_002784 [Pichia californica]|uniref:Uncharacterized protein n=1 Tax=Pichia californica TaxID=460514 RepID=A0A9P6WHB0_9ASCO|nr:hypothetical protein C6P40_002784 [[Candida] californica]